MDNLDTLIYKLIFKKIKLVNKNKVEIKLNFIKLLLFEISKKVCDVNDFQ